MEEGFEMDGEEEVEVEKEEMDVGGEGGVRLGRVEMVMLVGGEVL